MSAKVQPEAWCVNWKSESPKHEVMIVLGVVYPQLWATNTPEAENSFYSHLNVLKATFCVLRAVGQHGKTILALLLTHNLDLQCSHFKMTMIHNSEVVMCDQESSLNPITKL
jgi:hypothetical protein